ncbi:hypothetical protein GW17_00060937, partial [Ensete ventricosum]
MGNINVIRFLILALLFSVFPHEVYINWFVNALHEGASHNGTPSSDDYVPVSPVQYRAVAGGILAEPFKVCSDCTCCAGGDPNKCQPMKCCHQIKCDL